MHELGIIVHIAKTLDQVAAENELKKIGSVTLDIGVRYNNWYRLEI